MTPPPGPLPSTPPPPPEVLKLPVWEILGRSAMATAVVDLDGHVTYVNPALLALWGYADAEEVLGQPCSAVLWEDSEVTKAAQEILRTKHGWTGELQARRADGSTFPARVTAHVVMNSDGQPTAFIGSFTNVSDVHAREQAWRAERQFSDAVLGAAGVLALAMDEQGRIVRFNDECERVSGWRREEILGRCPWDTVLPREVASTVRHEAFAAAMAAAVPGHKSRYTNEWLSRHGSRHLIDWTNTILVDASLGRSHMVSIGVDVTAQREAEHALQRSRAQLLQAQSVAALGSWELDLVTGRLDWSPQVFALFELDPQHFKASYDAFLAHIHPDDRDKVHAAYSRSLETQRPYRIEHRLQMPDGRIKWVEERGESEFDAEGRPLRSRGTVQDVTQRRRREAELKRFRHLVDQAPQEIWVTDEGMRIRYVNAAAASSLSYEPDRLIGRSMADIALPGVAATPSPRGALPRPREVDHRAADERLVPKEVQESTLVVDGETFHVFFAHDITERRRAQLALVASEAQLREALDAYPGWVACVDEDMRYVYANATFAREAGRPATEMIGLTPIDVFGFEASETARAMHEQQRQGVGPSSVEKVVHDSRGEEHVLWIHYRTAPDARRAGRRLFYGYGIDITDLRRTEQRLSTVILGTGVGLWEWHCQTNATEFNDELLILLGRERAEAAGDGARWLISLVEPQDRAARRAAIEQVLVGAVSHVENQFRVRHPDGRVVWVQERVHVVACDDAGRPLRLMGTSQDISALKAQQEELRALNAELESRIEQRTRALSDAKAQAERANAAKSDFLSQMSHELRTPLNAIIGFSQLLELAELPAEEADHVQEVMRAGHHLLKLINEMLDLAAVESGRMQLLREPVGTADLVNECVQLLRSIAQQAGVRVESRVSTDCEPVLADRGRLKQVLLNLLSNAIKYNRRGGLVVVECDCDRDGVCEVRVTDTGPGLTAEQVARLFEPFERLGAASAGIPGTGIGLSVSKRLMELMQGTIGVSSEPACGSTFWVRLPSAEAPTRGSTKVAPEAAPSVPAIAAPQAQQQQRVLYLEDNMQNQRLMAGLLARRSDIDLIVTADSHEALSLARERQPGLILLDIQLPELDGYQVLERLRSQGIDTPVVAVSANAMPADVARGKAAGFADYLTKPLDLRRVLEVIDAQLPPTTSGRTT